MPEYEIADQCIKQGKGGIIIAVKRNIFGSFINVTTSTNKNILVGRVALGNNYLRIIAGYAPQEDDMKEAREEFFEDLSMEITKSKLANEEYIVLGDLNAKICLDSGGMLKSETSNGKLLENMINEQCLEVLNFSSKCSGKWTHVIRTTGQTSVLDYVLTSKKFGTNCVLSMVIDETCMLCPFSLKRVKKTKKKKLRGSGWNVKKQYSDHNTMVVEVVLPRGYGQAEKKKKQNILPRWRITDEGLEEVFIRTNEGFKGSIESYNDFEEYLRKCMGECFRPVSNKKGRQKKVPFHYQNLVAVLMKYYKQGKVQRNVVKKYMKTIEEQNEKDVAEKMSKELKTRMEQLTIDKKLSMDGFWSLKRTYVNKNSLVSSVINDRGVEICSESGILHEYELEFFNRLQPAEMTKDFKNFELLTNELAKLCTELSSCNVSSNFTDEELDVVIKDLQGNKAYPDSFPPEIFIHGGKDLRSFLLEVLNLIKNNQDVPDQWMRVKIATLYKNKGSLKKLINQRGIFLTPIMSKIFEKLIKRRITDVLTIVSKWQAGSRDIRCTMDQTFLLRGTINHAIYLNKPVFLTMYDFKQCFDKVWLEDAVLSLWKLGVRDDMLKLISILNAKSEVVVKTSIGETEMFELGPNTKQGTVLGPILSSASIAECCLDQKRGGATVGSAIVRSLAFVDDLAGVNHKVLDTHESHKVVVLFSKKKRQPLNEDKCVILPINVPDGMATPVMYVNGKQMEICDLAKYLGDIFNSQGNNNDLINDRVAKGMRSMICCMALASEITLGAYLISTLMSLHKIMFIPVVSFNSGAWNNITAVQMSKLRTVQLKFLKRIVHTPQSTANCFTFLEMGIVPIDFTIHINQLQFLYHILKLDEDDPVKMNYHQQGLFRYERNWYNEVTELRKKYEIVLTDEQIIELSKERWKIEVHSKVRKFALESLNKENAEKKKTGYLSPYTSFKPQEYFRFLSASDARLFFSVRSQTVDIKSLRKYNYDNGDSLCRLCEQEDETLEHIINRCNAVVGTKECIGDIFSVEKDNVVEVVSRLKCFKTFSEEMKTGCDDQE